MPTYVPISDAEIAAEQPVTVSLMTRLRDNALAYLGAPSGTVTVFMQTAAPLGWVKDTTAYNHALRLVGGAISGGGSVDFSTLFGRTGTDAVTLSQANLPNVNFSSASLTGSVGTAINITDPTHTHAEAYTVANNVTGGTNTGGVVASPQNVTASPTGISAALANGAVTFGGVVPSGGSGTPFTPAIDMRVKFTDVIRCTKD